MVCTLPQHKHKKLNLPISLANISEKNTPQLPQDSSAGQPRELQIRTGTGSPREGIEQSAAALSHTHTHAHFRKRKPRKVSPGFTVSGLEGFGRTDLTATKIFRFFRNRHIILGEAIFDEN
jgi:hypothetical protein